MYLFEYHKEHGINPQRAVLKNFETDTIRIKEKMTFKQIADLLDMPQSQLELLNPSYKLKVVPYYQNEQHFLRLPKDKIATFVANEDKIYAYAKYDSGIYKMPSRLAQKLTPKVKAKPVKVPEPLDLESYIVQKGDNLSSIAQKYDVAVADIKEWNNLKSNALVLGRSLKIKPKNLVSKATQDVVKKPVETAIASAETSDKNEIEVEYVVKNGDNLSSIAKKFCVTLAELKEWNNLNSNNIALGKSLIVSKKETTVVETTAVASNSIDSFKKKANAAKTIGEDYYVKKGDSLYSISKKYPGVTISDIKKWNGIKDEDIKPGMKLKING
jgi:membrane-bound lytic murein transglycosylase D